MTPRGDTSAEPGTCTWKRPNRTGWARKQELEDEPDGEFDPLWVSSARDTGWIPDWEPSPE